MAKITMDRENLENIANAIREKNGTEDTYLPSEMADAILAISGGDGLDKYIVQPYYHNAHMDGYNSGGTWYGNGGGGTQCNTFYQLNPYHMYCFFKVNKGNRFIISAFSKDVSTETNLWSGRSIFTDESYNVQVGFVNFTYYSDNYYVIRTSNGGEDVIPTVIDLTEMIYDIYHLR